MTHGKNIAVVDWFPQVIPVPDARVEDTLREVACHRHGVVAEAMQEQKLQRREVLCLIYHDVIIDVQETRSGLLSKILTGYLVDEPYRYIDVGPAELKDLKALFWRLCEAQVVPAVWRPVEFRERSVDVHQEGSLAGADQVSGGGCA